MRYTLHDIDFPYSPQLQASFSFRFNTTLNQAPNLQFHPIGNADMALHEFVLQFKRYSDDWSSLVKFASGRRGMLFGFKLLIPKWSLSTHFGGVGRVKTMEDGNRYLVQAWDDPFNPYFHPCPLATDVVFSGVGGSPVYEYGTGRVTGASSDGDATFAFKWPMAFANDITSLLVQPVTAEFTDVRFREIFDFDFVTAP